MIYDAVIIEIQPGQDITPLVVEDDGWAAAADREAFLLGKILGEYAVGLPPSRALSRRQVRIRIDNLRARYGPGIVHAAIRGRNSVFPPIVASRAS